MAKYRFILTAGNDDHTATPIWKNDMAKEYAFEQGQMFRRASLTDSLVFLNEDYDWIMSKSFATKIYVQLQVSWNEDVTYVNYWRGAFHRTDCTINTDDRIIKVKPNVEDQYNKILAGMDKEYDLIQLKPAITQVNMQRRPLLQIYTHGESIVSCFLGGMAWEEDVVQAGATSEEIQNTYHFAFFGNFTQVSFGTNPPYGLTTPFRGIINHATIVGEWPDLTNDDDVYYMTYFQSIDHLVGLNDCINGLRIKRKSDDALIWWFEQTNRVSSDEVVFLPLPTTFTFNPELQGGTEIEANASQANIYGRFLLAKQFQDSYELPEDDLVGNNRNYRYCYPYAGSVLKMTERNSNTPTVWGKRPDGKYYLKPILTADELLVVQAQYPVARSTWGYASIWLEYTENMAYNENEFRTPTTLRNAYMLEDVITALLSQIDNSLSFAADTEHSLFLYSATNPVDSDWGKNKTRLMITPKSNILVAEYSQPAQKAPITLKSVLDMLKNVCGLYWCIDSSNRLRIEHISYFKNGMSYSGSPSVGINVTQMYNSRNGNTWALATGTYSFDKLDMPCRYEFNWMDDTTDVFKGNPIEVLSTFVDEGKIEEVTVSGFNSDIDYMMLNPNNVSRDGFALLCAKLTGSSEWALQFGQFQIQDEPYVEVRTLQNYQLSFRNLQPSFLISDMPAWSIKLNNITRYAHGIQRKKKQQLSIPMGNTDGTLENLVHTTLGNGEIEKMQINLTSRLAKMTLRYDTE